MSQVILITLLFAIIAFATAMGFFLAHLLSANQRLAHLGLIASCAALAAQALAFICNDFTQALLGFSSRFDTLGGIALFLAFLFVCLTWIYRVFAVGALVTPVIMVLLSAQIAFGQDTNPLAVSLRSAWLYVHLFFSITADALLGLSALFAAAFLLQDHSLRTKSHVLLKGLPPLELLERLSTHLLILGNAFLSIGMLSGAFLAHHHWGAYWYLDPRQIFSFVTWFLFTLLSGARLLTGFRGRRASRAILISVLLAFLGLFALPLLSNTKHQATYVFKETGGGN